MKFFSKLFLSVAILAGVSGLNNTADAQSLSTLGSALSGALGNAVSGVFTTSNLDVKDLVGEWTSNGSAVSFQSENFLKKAGGTAVAGAIESQINPYYEKLGLNNAVLTVSEDGSFKLKGSKFTLSGTMTANGDGTFYFNFKAFNKVSLGKVKTYVTKTGNNIDVMFDATKLKTLISGIAKVTGISIAKTAASVLDSYEGLCVGFKMTGSSSNSGTSVSSAIGSALGKIIGGGSNSNSSTGTTTTTESAPAAGDSNASSTTTTKSGSSVSSQVSDALKNILKSTGK